MLKEKRVLVFGGASAALLVGLLVVFNGQGQANQAGSTLADQVTFGQSTKELEDAAAPIVDFDNPSTVDRISENARRLKNARYNKGMIPHDPDPRIGEIIGAPERRAGFSDLPVDRSDVIAEAIVGESRAFLSEDKTGLYSEFTIIVTKVKKVAPGVSVNLGDKIVTERYGGKVRYSSGKVIRCRIAGEGVPVAGKRYLFFLAKADQDSYKLLTGYEIQSDKVFALDGSRTESRGNGSSIFDKHNGEALDSFMGELERGINNSRVEGIKP